jgi:hypothetical protein
MSGPKRNVEINHVSRRNYGAQSQGDDNSEVWNQVRQHAGLFSLQYARAFLASTASWKFE